MGRRPLWALWMVMTVLRVSSILLKRTRWVPGNNVRLLASPFTTTPTNAPTDTKNVLEMLKDEVRVAMFTALDIPVGTQDPLVLPCRTGTVHGDYQCNVAMSLAKQCKIPPKEVANKLLVTLLNSAQLPHSVLRSADVSGPGFINLHLSDVFLQKRVLHMARDSTGRLGIPKTQRPQRIVIDFSSPNIAKEMHVGHLRSTIIGDALSRVLEFRGHDVVRLNHVGDWGTQFGMLIHFLKTHSSTPQDCDVSASAGVQGLQIADLQTFYKAAKQAFDDSEDFRIASRQEVVALQRGDPDSLFLWQSICDISRKEFAQIYELLNVHLQERGESFYNPQLRDIAEQLHAKGIAQPSDGALVVFPSEENSPDNQNHNENKHPKKATNGLPVSPAPLIVRKADGGFLYATTDLAALRHRVDVERADRLIYVTDAGQATHFHSVFAAATLAGWLPNGTPQSSERNVSAEHVGFGLVLGEDGKKIKSRSGVSVRLRELLDEAVRRARDAFLVREQLQQLQHTETETETKTETKTQTKAGDISDPKIQSTSSLDERAAALDRKSAVLGIAAVKYADLAMNRESNYRFSFDKMLSLTGNTAPYMLYAFVRIEGIKRKALEALQLADLHATLQSVDEDYSLRFTRAEELALAKHLLRSEEILCDVETSLYPNKICDYLLELSQKFNSFYENCPVIKADDDQQRISRVALCSLTSDTLKTMLMLLGIETLDRI